MSKSRKQRRQERMQLERGQRKNVSNLINNTSMSEGKKIAIFASVLAVIMLAGFFFLTKDKPNIPSEGIITKEGYQEVRMSVNGLDYEPSVLNIQSGQKVRWIIDASRAQGCARALYSPELGINTLLKAGENVIEFVPPRTGTIKFTCTMGMTAGQFEVA